jgi:hypothetical protein
MFFKAIQNKDVFNTTLKLSKKTNLPGVIILGYSITLILTDLIKG